jgi:hypothetical protein
MNFLIIDDYCFGLEGGKGIYGKEIYSEILARINEKMGNTIVRLVLGQRTGINKNVIFLRASKHPIIRTFHANKVFNMLLNVCDNFNIDIIHANIFNAHFPLNLVRLKKLIRIPLGISVHGWVYLCPTNFNTTFPDFRICNISSINRKCLRCVFSKAKRQIKFTLMGASMMLHQTIKLNKLASQSDFIISPSKSFAVQLIEKMEDKVYHLPNPVNIKNCVSKNISWSKVKKIHYLCKF